MKTEFVIALTQLAAERNLPKEVILRTVEAALVPVFKKSNFAPEQDISVRIAPQTGEVKVYARKVVVKRRTNPAQELSLSEAKKLKADAQPGETIEVESTPPNAGRIAAQTAKQVILQRLRDAERDAVFGEYADKEGEVVSGVVHYIEPKQIILDLGRAEAILPLAEQVSTEHYRVGQRIKLYLLKVLRTNRGTQLIVSRTHQSLLRRLFELEVPEIHNGTVELKALAREPGHRSKVAVVARQEGVDAVGCCVGLRSIRIQNISKELDGEKIDIVQWHPDPAVFIANALSPASIVRVEINGEGKSANVIVPDKQLSLAIGKGGQNARLAARLTGWRIDIKSLSMVEVEKAAPPVEEAAPVVEEAAPSEAVAVVEPVTEAILEPVAEEAIPIPEEVSERVLISAETPPEVEVPVEAEAPVKIYSVEEILSQLEVATGRSQSRFAEKAPAPISEIRAKKAKREQAAEEELPAPKTKAKKALRRRRPVDEDADLEGYLHPGEPVEEKADEEILSEIETATVKAKKSKKGSLLKDEIPGGKDKPKKAPRRQPILEDEEE
jgi:N utilization substance protein A